MNEAVRLEGVGKRFRAGGRTIEALVRLSFHLERGRLVGLVGPDGAGKTTLMRLLAGLLLPDEGRVTVLGVDTREAAHAVQARVGYMPQRFGLYDDLSVRENLDLYADLYGLEGEPRRRRLREILAATELAPFSDRFAGRLSGGMRQKLAMGVALLKTPELLLLDEPSVGVDPLSRRELWQLVRRLAGGRATILWSTAYLDEAERCERVLVLQDGRLIADGPPGELTRELEGRVFRVETGRGDRRPLLRLLRRRADVLDVTAAGGALRVVVEAGEGAAHLRGLDSVREITPVTPGLEDAVVALLRRERSGEDGMPTAGKAPADPPRPRREASEVVIRIRDLVRTFGSFRAVDGIGFEVRRGEIFGLLGPNGAGKSTTFKMLCGLLPPTSGEALVLGYDLLRAAPAARAHIGYMAQKFSLYADLTPRQNLHFTADAYGLVGPRRRRRLAEAIAEFGLAEMLDQRSGDLPLGYKQRLSMACALLNEPEILFLDEPTSGVDPLARRAFWTRIMALAEAGVTVMVTTHFLDEAEYCDRIAIIERGRLLGIGTPDEIIEAGRRRSPEVTDLEEAFVALLEERRREAA